MERYLGIDVHRDSCTVAVLSAKGKKTQQHVVPTEGAALVECVRSLTGSLHVCVEEGEWSEWLVEILTPWVDQVVVSQTPWRPGPKSDATDARELAERLRTGRLGTPIYKAPRQWAALREAVRLESKLTQDVVRTKQRLKSLYRRRGLACRNDELYSPRHRAEWVRQLPPSFRLSAEVLGQELDVLRDLQQTAEKRMLEAARKFSIRRILETAPGIGPKRAARLLAIVVTPYRFRGKRLFWSYCGLAVVTKTSSDWVPQAGGRWVRAPVIQTRGLNRACNRQLKDLFKGAALSALQSRPPNPLRDAYERMLEAGTKPNLAQLTIARKIAAIVLAMWKSESKYKIMS